jgi:BMFP domain-containing protein YqiC
MKESAIINDIEPIEELIQRFSDVIPASYEEAKDEIENNIQDKMGV